MEACSMLRGRPVPDHGYRSDELLHSTTSSLPQPSSAQSDVPQDRHLNAIPFRSQSQTPTQPQENTSTAAWTELLTVAAQSDEPDRQLDPAPGPPQVPSRNPFLDPHQQRNQSRAVIPPWGQPMGSLVLPYRAGPSHAPETATALATRTAIIPSRSEASPSNIRGVATPTAAEPVDQNSNLQTPLVGEAPQGRTTMPFWRRLTSRPEIERPATGRPSPIPRPFPVPSASGRSPHAVKWLNRGLIDISDGPPSCCAGGPIGDDLVSRTSSYGTLSHYYCEAHMHARSFTGRLPS
jgi:hypothetical protein